MKYKCLLDPMHIYSMTIRIIGVNLQYAILLLPLCHSDDISSYLFAFSFATRT